MYTCPTPNPGSRLRLRPTRGCGCLAAAAAAAPAPSAAAPPAAVLAAGCCCCCRCCCWLRLRLSSSIKRLRTHTKRELQMAREHVFHGQFKRGNVQPRVCSRRASCRSCRRVLKDARARVSEFEAALAHRVAGQPCSSNHLRSSSGSTRRTRRTQPTARRSSTKVPARAMSSEQSQHDGFKAEGRVASSSRGRDRGWGVDGVGKAHVG